MCRLSFRVRNGTGRFPAAIDHRQTYEALVQTLLSAHFVWVLCQILHSGRGHNSDYVSLLSLLLSYTSVLVFVVVN